MRTNPEKQFPAVESHLEKARFRFTVPCFVPSRTLRTLCLLLLVACPHLSVAAVENPFELPAPRDPKAPGR